MEAALDIRVFMHDYLREFFETAVAGRTERCCEECTSSEDDFDAKPYTTFCKILDGSQS